MKSKSLFYTTYFGSSFIFIVLSMIILPYVFDITILWQRLLISLAIVIPISLFFAYRAQRKK